MLNVQSQAASYLARVIFVLSLLNLPILSIQDDAFRPVLLAAHNIVLVVLAGVCLLLLGEDRAGGAENTTPTRWVWIAPALYALGVIALVVAINLH